MNRKTLAHWSWWFTSIVLIGVVGLAAFIVQHVLILVLAAVAAAAGAYGLGRRHGRAGVRRAARRRLDTRAHVMSRPPRDPGQARGGQDNLTRLREENRALKAKCEELSDMINGPRRQP